VIHYGFDRRKFYLRVDPSPERASELSDAELEVELERDGFPLRLCSRGDGWRLLDRDAQFEGGPGVFGRALELAVPFDRLSAHPGAHIAFAVRLSRGEVVLGRYPSDGMLGFTVPDESFEAEHWSV
jgi:hypothetical protein